jgi:chemotaxis protein MotA
VDKGTIIGIVLAAGAILLGLFLEGGQIGQILQPTAALIVFGGTLGAILVQFPLKVVITAFLSLATVLFEPKDDPRQIIQEIVTIAHKARREGIVSLDNDLDKIQNPFLRKTLMLAVDGTEPGELRKMMELDLEKQGEHEDNIPEFLNRPADSRRRSASLVRSSG